MYEILFYVAIFIGIATVSSSKIDKIGDCRVLRFADTIFIGSCHAVSLEECPELKTIIRDKLNSGADLILESGVTKASFEQLQPNESVILDENGVVWINFFTNDDRNSLCDLLGIKNTVKIDTDQNLLSFYDPRLIYFLLHKKNKYGMDYEICRMYGEQYYTKNKLFFLEGLLDDFPRYLELENALVTTILLAEQYLPDELHKQDFSFNPRPFLPKGDQLFIDGYLNNPNIHKDRISCVERIIDIENNWIDTLDQAIKKNSLIIIGLCDLNWLRINWLRELRESANSVSDEGL